ncbi:MAG: nucleoside kinase [Anaerolineae bacterium]|nr:nucleoside kinase [Anaerolineae bacterium]
MHATFADGRTFEGPIGTPVETFAQAAMEPSDVPTIAALVNGELRELSYPLISDATIEPLSLSSSDGVRIYRRSLAFLMVATLRELYPEAPVTIDHSVPSGGFLCHIQDRPPFTLDELAKIEVRMHELVKADLPITRERVPLDDVVTMLTARGEMEKVELLKRRQKDSLSLYNLNGQRDYFHGYMVPSTGYVRCFALQPCEPGFVLQYPRRHRPTEILPLQDSRQLMATFRQYGEWLRLLGVESLSDLNRAIETDRIREIILVSEALHEQQVTQIVQMITDRMPKLRLVLVAGPSAAGKTTFSKRLSIQLLAQGIRPFPLEMDNYFVDRELTPRDPDGNYDFETLEALDVKLFNENLTALMQGKEIQLPRFNFRTGHREPGRIAQIGPEHVIIVEGIHGLNPTFVPSIPAEWTFRIFVSAVTQLNIDRHNRVPTTDTRLIRRIVRDATDRGYSAEETLDRWESVRRGEKRHIIPYQDHADAMFNSALVYELSVLKRLAEPLLLQVEPKSPRRVEAKRLLTFLRWFETCAPDKIPDNSILREFVGGSILRDYTP